MPIVFSISRKQYKGQAEVHMRFYHGRGCDLRARTRIYVPVSAWNETDGRCNISRRYESTDNILARNAQAELDALADRVASAFASSGCRVSREWLQRIIDKSIDEKPLADLIDDYCAVRNVAPRTVYKLHSLRLHLLRFEQMKNKRLYAHTMSTDDLDALVRYFRTTGALGQNALASRMRQIRALVYFGGKPYPNPFDTFNMPQEVYADPTFLTIDERNRIASFSGLSVAKQVQRDIFVFQCHTGCRVSDMYALTPANVRDGWLVYTPQKTERETGRVVELPLSPAALDIIRKYHGCDLRGRLLPFISDVKYNAAIRDICKQVGIDRPVMWRNPRTGKSEPRPLYEIASSHLARRTFAQMAYSATGDKRLAASMTGHSENSRAFERYSEVTREMKRRALGI